MNRQKLTFFALGIFSFWNAQSVIADHRSSFVIFPFYPYYFHQQQPTIYIEPRRPNYVIYYNQGSGEDLRIHYPYMTPDNNNRTKEPLSQPPYALSKQSELRVPVDIHSKAEIKEFLKSRGSKSKQQKINIRVPESQQKDNLQAIKMRDRLMKEHAGLHKIFDEHFYDNHDSHPPFEDFGARLWTGFSWSQLNQWLGWNLDSPIYLDHNREEYQLTSTDSSPDQPGLLLKKDKAAEGSWFPLGVFALDGDMSQASNFNMFVQLAVNQEGEIKGTYYHLLTDNVTLFDGLIDKETQEVLWKMSNRPDAPLFITSVYNLSQDAVTIRAHFPNKPDQSWVMIRLKP